MHRSMGAEGRLDGDHGEVALQRGLSHPVSGPQAGLGRRGAGQQQGQLHRALQAASELCEGVLYVWVCIL